MAEERVQRRLAAILAADVVGHSWSMAIGGTDRFIQLEAHGNEQVEQEIARYHGRVFRDIGDGHLAEFDSVVDAMECADSLQRAIAASESGADDDPHFGVRIGIDFGEVIVDGMERRGECVTVAAKLQQLAGIGGICLSRAVYDHVKNRVSLGFASLGEHQFENVAEPVAIYRIVAEDIPESSDTGWPPRGHYLRL